LQDNPSDNGLYHLAFTQNNRYVFGAEESIALLFCLFRLPIRETKKKENWVTLLC
jgi:hypothetical protein